MQAMMVFWPPTVLPYTCTENTGLNMEQVVSWGDTATAAAAAAHRAHSGRVVALHVVAQLRVTRLPQRLEGGFALVRLHVARLLPQVVKVEGQAVPWVMEPSLAKVAVFCDENLIGGETRAQSSTET